MKENDIRYWNDRRWLIDRSLHIVNARKRQMDKDVKECVDNIARIKLILAEKIRRCK